METIITLENILIPPIAEEIIDRKKLNINQWGNQIHFYTGEPDEWKEFDVAFLSIYDTRLDKTTNPNDTPKNHTGNFDSIRRELYQLYNWHEGLKFIDLGTLQIGERVQDTFVVVEQLLAELIRWNVLPIFVCNSQELTYAQFKAYEIFNEKISVANFDERIDLNLDLTNNEEQSYIYKMLAHQPNLLENYYQLGYQNFLVNPTYVDMLFQKHCECFRLSYFLDDMKRLEPFLRATDMVSLDVSVVRHADAPGQKRSSPNGMTAHDVCRIGRYAGISDALSSFGIYNFAPEADVDGLTAQLIAQTIWHFSDGFYSRKHDNPQELEEQYLQYKVALNNYREELTFLKSPKNERWWMKIPVINGDEETYKLLPCSEEEYRAACRREIPERWMKAFIKYST